jgi:hypothetical protein
LGGEAFEQLPIRQARDCLDVEKRLDRRSVVSLRPLAMASLLSLASDSLTSHEYCHESDESFHSKSA